MGNHGQEKTMGKHLEVRKEDYGTKEEIKEAKNKSEKKDSLESVKFVEKRDVASASVPRRDRNEEEKRVKAKEKNSRDITTAVNNLATGQAIPGQQERVKESKEEHTQWNGKRKMKRSKRQDHVSKKPVLGQDPS